VPRNGCVVGGWPHLVGLGVLGVSWLGLGAITVTSSPVIGGRSDGRDAAPSREGGARTLTVIWNLVGGGRIYICVASGCLSHPQVYNNQLEGGALSQVRRLRVACRCIRQPASRQLTASRVDLSVSARLA
jgi:hypothetical protein